MTTHKINNKDWTDYVSDVVSARNKGRDGSKKELVYIPPRKEKETPPDWAVRVVVGDLTGREPNTKRKVFSALLFRNSTVAECHGECALEVDAARLLRGSKPAASVHYLALSDSIMENNKSLKFVTKEEALAA